jgi:xanthine dehydrogenase YagR molybdenum-binding subunit
VLGGKLPRIDGALKVSGRATYTSDFSFPGMFYAVPVRSTIANGRVLSIDDRAARKLPGVRAVYYRGNMRPFFRSAPPQGFSGILDEHRPPFEDDVVRYYGQFVAVAVAQTMEQARAAAEAVRVTYATESHFVGTHLAPEKALHTDSERGDAEAAFQSAPVKVDYTYVTPTEVHNPIELHASVAVWEGDTVTLYETTQAVVNHREVMYQILGVPKENVRVVSRFLGSGFGGKLWPWTHSIIAAGVAREIGAPVKCVVTRQSMFETVGHRPRTQQRFRLGATNDGKLVSLLHEYVTQTSMLDDVPEDCGESTPFLYSVPSLKVASALARANMGTPTAMRGPGAVPGLFAMESAMDELAVALAMDPIELRKRNEPVQDESRKVPFSSRHLVECMQVGAEKFGWSQRDPRVGAMKRDGLTIGFGMATCCWGAMRIDTQAALEIRRDGSALVTTATQDIGTGTYTVLALVASEVTGIPIDKIDVQLGDTMLPAGPISGGSWTTASVIPAVSAAARAAVQSLLGLATNGPTAPFKGAKVNDLQFANGKVSRKSESSSGVSVNDVLARANVRAVMGNGSSGSSFTSEEARKYSLHSFGAHFAEVTWQPETARLRVSRFVSVIDAGRMLNPTTARNQIEGAVVMGVGMALFEAARYDTRYGAPINNNLADYLMSTHADAPAMDVTFLDHPDMALNELGARGVGEIGLAGTAAAITSAIYHATGVRVRELPVRIEDLLRA